MTLESIRYVSKDCLWIFKTKLWVEVSSSHKLKLTCNIIMSLLEKKIILWLYTYFQVVENICTISITGVMIFQIMTMSHQLMLATLFVEMLTLLLGTLLIIVLGPEDAGAKIATSWNTVNMKIMSSQVLWLIVWFAGDFSHIDLSSVPTENLPLTVSDCYY